MCRTQRYLLAALASLAIGGALMSPAAAGAADLFDTPKNTLVDVGNSIGGVKLKAWRKTAVSKFGKPDSTQPGRRKTQFCDVYGDLGASICYVRAPGKVKSAVPRRGKGKTRVKSWNGRVYYISTVNPAFRTADGIGIGSDWQALQNQYVGTELNWGTDQYGNPPAARAYEFNDPDDLGLTRFLVMGMGTPEDPATVANFAIGRRGEIGSLYDFFNSQVPHP